MLFIKKVAIDLFILMIIFNAQGQDIVTIQLDTKVYYKLYSKEVMEQLNSKGFQVTNEGFVAGDYQSTDIAFRIALNNVNNDIYNEIGEDDIMLGKYQADSIYTNPKQIKENMLIGNEDMVFEIIEIDPKGTFIKIKPVEKIRDLDVRLFDRLPDQEFELVEGSKANLRDYQGHEKYIYVEVWGTWCHPCIEAVEHLKEIQKKYGDRLTIIYLNYKDNDREKVKNYLIEAEIDWVNGYTNEMINQAINLGGIPHGVLFAPDGKLIVERLHPEKLLKYLENHIFK